MFDSVTVTAAARLHLGFLDMNGGLGRRFGSLGLAIDRPATRLTIRRAPALAVEGLEAERAERHLARLARHLDLIPSYGLTIHECHPGACGPRLWDPTRACHCHRVAPSGRLIA